MPILNSFYGGGSSGGGNIGEPLNLTVTTSGLNATITWEDNEIGTIPPTSFVKSELIRKIGSAPTSPSDGTLVVTETVKDTYKVNGYVDSGLTEGETYYYRVFSYSDLGGISYCDAVSVTPVVVREIEFLMVGGGGAGGSWNGGGGGAGGVIYQTDYDITSGTYPISIGDGGIGYTGDDPGTIMQPANSKGGDTTFLGLTAYGGGTGGGRTNAVNGLSGGCGGGGGGWSGTGTGGSGTNGQGYAGGNGKNASGTAGQGGGGGAGGVGTTATRNGGFNGGDGIVNPITGSTSGELVNGEYWIAGGGGGGKGAGSAGGGDGGKGGGGAGSSANGVNGTDGSTYGAGGGGSSEHATSGSGYQGIVIIKYKTGDLTATGGTVTTSGDYTIHTFTSDGNFVVS